MVGIFTDEHSMVKISEAIHCAKTTQKVLTPIAEFYRNSMVSQKETILSKPYHCQNCIKHYKSSDGLKYHMEKEHDKDGECKHIGGRYIHTENVPFSVQSPEKHIKPVPPALTIKQQTDFTSCPGLNWLAEFAVIATSPQSPLVQRSTLENKSEVPMKATDYNSTQQYLQRISPPPQLVDPNPFRHISEPYSFSKEESDARVTSSSPYPSTVTTGSDNWSHFWPKEAWLCFIRGTRVRLMTMDEWRSAEDVGHDASLCASAAQRLDTNSSDLSTYAPYGVRLIDFREIKDTVLATFDSTVCGQPRLYAEFASDHPFFVKNKGWTSVRPGLAAAHYGIPCQRLQAGDICLPPSHPDAVSISPRSASPKSENTNTFDFTAMDSNAVLTLSNMAKQRREHDDLRSKILSSDSQNIAQPPTKKAKTEPERAKRPMNAFMLFAKRYRLEITQMYPGKDNRAISVILGDKWKSMKQEERKAYVIEAKILADEHKRIHPDCWKRKRTTQGSSKVAGCRRL